MGVGGYRKDSATLLLGKTPVLIPLEAGWS
jgi:hypothetical protein